MRELLVEIVRGDSPSYTINVPDLAVGEYNVTVEYSNDPNYNSNNASTVFHVDKANVPDANMTVVPTNITYLDDETIVVTVNVTNATGKVTIKINGTDVDLTESVDSDGKATFTVPGLVVGEYNVTAVYHDDPNYNDANASALFHVDPIDSSVTVVPTNITYLENETITVSVPITNATGTVVVKINGTEVNRTKFDGTDNPTITISVPDLAVGEYNVTVEYIDDPNYNDANASALFHVDKANIPDANVTVVPTNITYLDDETITVTVNVTNATGNVTIKINGTDVVLTKNITEDGSNTVTFTVPGLVVGEYNVTVEYTDDANYNDTNASAPFHVDKAVSNVSVEAVNITYLENGGDSPSYTINVPDLAVGEYNVTVEYSNDPNYNSSNASTVFHVDKANVPAANMTVVPTNITYLDDETIIVTVNVSNASGKVTITINGTDVDLTESVDSDGKATFTVPGLVVGEYNVTAVYHDDPNYNDANASALFHVDPAESSLTVVPTNITYNDDETITVTVPITNATGKVTITINGTDVNLTESVDSDGKATFTVPGLVAGEYNVTAKYHDDPNYNGSEASALFHVDKDNITNLDVNTVNITYGDNETIKITIGDKNATGNITIKVNGTEYGPQELVDGSITFNVPGLVAGDYEVNVTYSGDDNYNATTADASFKVDKATPNVYAIGTNITYGSDEQITAIVDGKNITGNVTIYIDGQPIDTVDLTPTETGGRAVLNVPGISAGDHNVTVVYNGDANHYSSNGTDNFTVSKAKPAMVINTTDIDYHEIENITVNVTGVEGGVTPTGTVNVTVTGDNGVTR